MKKLILTILTILIVLSSCTVTERLTLNNKQGGRSESDIAVEDFFIAVLEDFGEFLPSSDKSIMDEAMEGFSSQLKGTQSATSVALNSSGNNQYKLSFSYSELSNLIKEFGVANQSLLKETANSFSIYIDINNFEELTKVVPFLADPNFEVYGPIYNQGTSEEDYLDMIYYLLGEDGPEAIKNGLVTIDIKAPGTIQSITNGVMVDSTTARFSFPIIDFLLLNKPLSFSVTWN